MIIIPPLIQGILVRLTERTCPVRGMRLFDFVRGQTQAFRVILLVTRVTLHQGLSRTFNLGVRHFTNTNRDWKYLVHILFERCIIHNNIC